MGRLAGDTLRCEGAERYRTTQTLYSVILTLLGLFNLSEPHSIIIDLNITP